MKSNSVQRVLGLVGWFGTALVFAAVAVRFFKPEWYEYAIYGAWAGLVCVLLYVFGGAMASDKRQMRYGAMASISVLVVLGILIAVNYLSNRQNKRWDLTTNKQFSLSEQTVQLLHKLDAPVKFLVFDQETNFDRFRDRLNEYDYNSDKVSVEYVDADKKPVLARQYEIQSYGTVVIEYKDRKERVTSDSEQDITNALIKAVSGQEHTVYFIEGHGEKDPTSTEREGYSGTVDMLRRDNYKTEKLPLAQRKDVPDDATAVVIAGPTTDFLPGEIDALRRYLAKAGKLMVMLDPPVGPQAGSTPNLEALLKEWGIQVGRNVVVDVSGLTNEPSLAVAINYPNHPISERLRTLTMYPLAQSVDPITGGSNGRTAQPIVQTSDRSWAETSLDTLSTGQGVQLETDKGDKAGPITVAAAVSAPAEQQPPLDPKAKPDPNAPKPESRVVVFGDSDFAANAYAGIQGNPNLFANAVNWLAQQENLIAIRPKEADDRRITLTAQQQMMIFWLSLVVVPAAVLGAGVWTWSRRRQ
jgi:ABC-type uncharacterized transport system involved in gliding motility auxiliary subunit